ncbi:MAG TPA: SMP-30/gluconolactonase/LRE family protein [Candidatus Dormibacteraeota bacterium]|nr:SMP-30/gluconolactonase/LRE family protein [Candidatus Dormibacteraeota bacterium]
MGRARLAGIAIGLATGIICTAAQATAATMVVVGFTAPGNPESIAIDHKGDIFMSLPLVSKVVEMAPGSQTPTVFATLPGNVLGVRLDENGDLFAAVLGAGVFEVKAGTKTPVRVAAPGSGAPEFFWNGMAFDHRGNLFVSESHFGEIWRLGTDGSFTRWIASDLLLGTTNPGPCGIVHPAIAAGFGIIGANGVFFDKHGDMLVNNTDLGTVVRIPLNPDGSAGTASVLAGPSCTLWGADGGALDNNDNLYVAANSSNRIVKVRPDGTFTVFNESTLFNFPTDIAFGTGRGDRKVAFVPNLGLKPDGSGVTDGSLLSMDVGVPGRPLP